MLRSSPLPRERTERVLYALILSNALSPFDTQQLQAHHRKVQGSFAVTGQLGAAAAPQGARRPSKLRASFMGVERVSHPSEAQAESPAPAVDAGEAARGVNKETERRVAEAEAELKATLTKAEELFGRGEVGDALFALERIAKRHPYSAPLHVLRATIWYSREVASDKPLSRTVVDLVDQALELDPDETRALFLKGVELRRVGESARAAHYFRRVLDDDPDNIDARRELHRLRTR